MLERIIYNGKIPCIIIRVSRGQLGWIIINTMCESAVFSIKNPQRVVPVTISVPPPIDMKEMIDIS